MKRILVFAVSFMMIVSSASVFAAEELTGIDVTKEGPKTSSEKKETKGKTALSSESEKGAKSKDLKAEAYCTAVTRNYNTTKASNPAYISTNGSSSWTVYSVYVKATGYLSMDVETGPNNDYSAQFAVGTFDGSTFTYYGPKSVSAGSSEEFIGGMDVKAGNTYWFGIKTSGYAEAYCAPYVVPYTTRSLPAGKTMLTAARKNGTATTALYKIKATKTGYISVALKEYGSSSSAGYVTLLNSKKKAISDKLWYYSKSKTSYVVFGVKKGSVYYLKCYLPYGSYSHGYTYGTAWKNYSASYKKNLKKSKSLKLKRKAKAKSMARPANGKKNEAVVQVQSSKETKNCT